MKKILSIVLFSIGFIVLLLLLFTRFWVSDIRPDYVRKQIDEVKGRELLQETAVAMGAVYWPEILNYEVDFEDEFFGQVGKASSPFEQNPASFTLRYQRKGSDANLIFPDSSKWGIFRDKTFSKAGPDAKVQRGHDGDIAFWLPTYKYFIQFPYLIREATAVSYAGSAEEDGQNYELVYATWDQYKPQRHLDQYVIWIHPETKHIFKIQYTVREQFPFLTGTAYFKDYQTFGKFTIPTRMPVGSNIIGVKGLLHEMRIRDIRFNNFNPGKLVPI